MLGAKTPGRADIVWRNRRSQTNLPR